MSRGNRKSLWFTIKHRDPEGIGISYKISQKESQKIEYILPVLDYLIKYREFYASALKQKFDDINAKSIDNTILLLQEKNLISLKRVEIKNKKVFKIKSVEKIRSYRDDLQKYRRFMINAKAMQQTKNIKNVENLVRINNMFDKILSTSRKFSQHYTPLPENFYTKPLYIENKKIYSTWSGSTKEWPEPISINDIRASFIPKITADYREGQICHECFNQGQLRYNEIMDDQWVCRAGHVSPVILYEVKSHTEDSVFDPSKISKKLTAKGFDFQRRSILKKKEEPASSLFEADY